MWRSLEGSLLRFVNGLRTPALDPWMAWLTEWGIYVFLAVLPLMALRTRSPRDAAFARDGWLSLLAALFVAESVIKPLVQRARPTAAPELAARLHVLGAVPSRASLSFPSGTAAACWGAAVFIGLAWGRRAGAGAMTLAALVSLSRLYAGVHWPSDLVGGALVGAGAAYGVWRLSRWAQSAARPV